MIAADADTSARRPSNCAAVAAAVDDDMRLRCFAMAAEDAPR